MNSLLILVYGLIIFYILISLLMIFAVIVHKERLIRKNHQQDQVINDWKERAEAEGWFVINAQDIEHLKDPDYLLSFMQLFRFYEDRPDRQKKLRKSFDDQEHFLWVLGDFYASAALIAQTYFACFCIELDIPQEKDSPLIALMQSFLHDDALYSNNKVLRAICSFGSIQGVVESYQMLSERGEFYHAPLVTDELIYFSGDKQVLVDALWQNFDSFDTVYQIGIIDYFYEEGGHLKDELIVLLEDKTLDTGLAAALMCYYRKYTVQAYKEILFSWMAFSSFEDWEIRAVTALTLARYPGEDTVQLLEKQLQSNHWFIRKSAAIALDELNAVDPDIQEVLLEENTEAVHRLTYFLASKG